jgi:hypothetical protein
MPKGEKVLAQSKRIAPAQSKRTAPPPTNLKKRTTTYGFLKKWSFQISISFCVQKGEKVLVSSKICKTLLNTKRRISLRGSFVLVKGKAFETEGENFKSWKCFFQSYSYTFECLQKDFWKEFYKGFAKTKLVVQAWSKILNK